MKVEYFAIVREITNLGQETLDVGDSITVMDLLKLLGARHGDKLKEYVLDSKTANPRTYLQLLLNGKTISSMEGFSTVITSDSTFAIIPPVGGGYSGVRSHRDKCRADNLEVKRM